MTSHLTGQRSFKTIRGQFKKIKFEGEKAVLGPFRTREAAEAGAHELADFFTRRAAAIDPGPRYMQDLRRAEGQLAGRLNSAIPESMRGYGTLRQYRQAGLSPRANVRAPGVEGSRALPASDARSRRRTQDLAARAEAERALGRGQETTPEEAAGAAQREQARQERLARQEEQRAAAEAEAEARTVAEDLPLSLEDIRTFADISETLEEFADYLGRSTADPEVRRTFAERKRIPLDAVDTVGKADARAGERGAVDVELLTAPVRAAGEAARIGLAGPRTTLEALTAKAGKAGRELVGKMQQYRDRLAQLEGDWSNRIRQGLRVVGEENWPKIQRALEGEDVRLTTEEEAGVGIIRRVLKDVSGRAEDVGRLVGNISQYFPRYMIESPDIRTQAEGLAKEWWGKKGSPHARRMRDLGATTPSDPAAVDYAASALLFREFSRYGGIDPHLEIPRRYSERAYITDPRVLLEYAASAARAISTGDVFDQVLVARDKGGAPAARDVQGPIRPGDQPLGQRVATERRRLGKFEDLMSRVRQEGDLNERQLNAIQQTLERELGFERRKPVTSGEGFLNAVQQIWAASKLGTSFLTQPLVLQDVAGILGAGRLAQGIGEVRANRQRSIDRAVRAGSIEAPDRLTHDMALALREQGVELRRGDQASWLEGVAEKYRNAFWMRWMLQMDAGARVVSDAAARRALPSIVADLKSGQRAVTRLMQQTGIDAASLQRLSPDALERVSRGLDPVSPADRTIVDRYARRMVEHTNQRVRAADLPAAWATGGPLIRFATLFMSYPYRQSKTILKTIATDPRAFTRYMVQGVPVGMVLGNALQMLKSVIAGYGALGDEERKQLPSEDRDFVEDARKVLDNRPIRVEDERSAFLRLVQGAMRGMPKPFVAQWLEKIARGRAGGQDVTGLGQITGQMLQLVSALSGFQPAIEEAEDGTKREIPYWENALRTTGATIGNLAMPFWGTQIGREIGLQGTPFGGFTQTRPASSPGIVGRSIDYARGETTLGQLAGGVLFGGEEYLSENRLLLKRKAELAQLKDELEAAKLRAGTLKGRPEKTVKQIESDIRKKRRELQKLEGRNAGR